MFSGPGISPALSRNEASVTLAPPQASTIMASLGQAAFAWDVASDEIVWSDHVAAVFPDIPPEALRSGSAFSKLIEPNRAVRTDALTPSLLARSGVGAPYRIEYGVRASTAAPVTWIEESGVWFADSSGRPVRVQGIVRSNSERHARDEQLHSLQRNGNGRSPRRRQTDDI